MSDPSAPTDPFAPTGRDHPGGPAAAPAPPAAHLRTSHRAPGDRFDPRALRRPPATEGPPERGPSWSGSAPTRADELRRFVDLARVRLGAHRSVGLAVATVVLVGAAGGAWWWVTASESRSSGATAPFVAGGTTIPFAGPQAGGSTTVADPVGGQDRADGGAGADIVVHAAGAVARPGVHQLPATARVGDLIAAAGGLAPDADPDRLNLAEPLGDGMRVYVPSVGEEQNPTLAPVDRPGGATGPAGAGTGATGRSDGSPSAGAVIDLNRATATELEALPGVGPATAQAIVAFRAAHGPFGSVDALLEVRGIGPAKLAQIRPLVRV